MQTSTPDRQEFWRYTGLLAIATGGFILLMSLVFLVFTGNTTRLSCWATENQRIDCEVQNTWFGLFRINAQLLQGVRQAEVGEHCDEDGDCTYRLELIVDPAGRTPLTEFYSAGRAEKQAAQERIASYLQQSGVDELSLTITGAGSQTVSTLLSILAGLSGIGMIGYGIRVRQRNQAIT